MTLPNQITMGFSFDEAINLAEFCQRAHQVFAQGSSSDAKERYNILHKGDEWVCVHALRTTNTEALILNRTQHAPYGQQFALVFGDLPSAAQSPAQPSAAPGIQPDIVGVPIMGQTVPVTNLKVDGKPQARPSAPGREIAEALEYQPIAGELAPPLLGTRVYRPWLEAFEECKAEIELFFGALLNFKFAEAWLADRGQSVAGDSTATSAAPGAAFALKFGAEAGEKIMQTLTEFHQQARASQAKKATVALEDQLAKESASYPTLVDLSAGFELYVTGHGTDGCVAALCALYLHRKWESRIDFPTFTLKMYNFGSPKIGNKAFVDYYNQSMLGFSYRVQNLLDRATHEPWGYVPFPYNLTLFLPGVDYVRRGNEYFTIYEHIGKSLVLPGVGMPTLEFNVQEMFKPLMSLPFSHDAAGYKAMLQDANDRQTTLQASGRQIVAIMTEQRDQLVLQFQSLGR